MDTFEGAQSKNQNPENVLRLIGEDQKSLV